MGFPGGSDGKKSPLAIWETWVRSLGREDPLEERMATHSGCLAWRIPMYRGAWQATVHGVTKSRAGLSDFYFHFLEMGKATHSSILAWRIPMYRGAWQASAHGVASTSIGLKRRRGL